MRLEWKQKLAEMRVPELHPSKAEIFSNVFGILFIIHHFVTNYAKKKKKVPAYNSKHLLFLFVSVGQESRSGFSWIVLAEDQSGNCIRLLINATVI